MLKGQMNVAAYCRVSTDKRDQVNSLESQIKYFTEYIIEHKDWKMVEVYYDEGISGTSVKKRAGFNRMIQDANNGQIDLILTKEVSRFARNTVDTLYYTRELKSNHVGVIFVTDNIDTRDADGELRLTIMASIAQEESRKTSERVKWGQKRRMEQGIVFGRDMLGYDVRNGELMINPDEADIVKLIFHKFLNEGKGTHVIARELWEAGIQPKRAKQWSNTVILRVLRNEKYVGDLCQKKTYTPDYLNHTKKYNRGHEEMVYLKDHHEPIIDRIIWDKTGEELARRSSTDEQKTKHSNRYWCSGKLICGECGQRFVSRTKKLKNGDIYKAWRCCAAANHGVSKTDHQGHQIGCDSGSVNEKVLLACVAYVMKHIQSNKDSIIKDMAKEIRAVQAGTNIDISALYAETEELNAKKTKAIDLVLSGIIGNDDLRQQNEYYNQEIERITAKISRSESINKIHRKQMEGIQNYIAEIRRMMQFDSDNELLYREVLERIEIHNKNMVAVYLKCIPFGIKLYYATSGRADKFTVNVDFIKIIEG